MAEKHETGRISAKHTIMNHISAQSTHKTGKDHQNGIFFKLLNA